MIIYKCNGERPECKDHHGCHKNGGECYSTTERQYGTDGGTEVRNDPNREIKIEL